MRRSRWDHKPEIEEPIASGSQCYNQCSVNWDHHERPQDSILHEQECLNTPHPLDYSNDNRHREKKDANIEISKDKSESSHRKTSPEAHRSQNPLHPTHWSYPSNIPQIYPSSSQNTQSPFSSHTPWNQIQPGFFTNDTFHCDQMFDAKFWDQQRLPIHSRLGLNEDTRKNPEKLDLPRSGHWSFNSRYSKHNDRSYDMPRRYGRYQSGNFDRSHKNYRDSRNFHPSSGLSSRYKYEGYKRSLLPTPDPQTLANIWRFNREYSDHSRSQDYSQIYRHSPGIIPNNAGFLKRFPNKFKAPLKNAKEKSPKSPLLKGNVVNKKRKKKEKNKDSAAELAKKKALAAAANKLKKTFLAAKKCTKSLSKKSKERTQGNKRVFEGASNLVLMKKNIQNLSVPKSIPKEGTSLEHDIDIKFSAQEWESVGRGEGGMQNVLDIPSEASKSHVATLEETNSDSDSVQTINDDDEDSVKELTDESQSSEEEEENSRSWSRGCQSPTHMRRRHVSETIKVEIEDFSSHSKSRRVRSYSTSQVEEISPEKSPLKSSSSFITSNLKNLLVKQLLSMDKKSLKELVNDPKSRKAQFMMNHFMDIHRTALSQKLNQLRFKSLSFPSAVEDRNLFQSFDPVHLEDLPADLLQQVKEILDFEAEGKAQQMWEEVSLSLSDLMAGLNGTSEPFKPSGSTDPLLHADEGEEDEDGPEQLQHQPLTQLPKRVLQLPPENNIDDADCQIVTPPPKLPATTITIPDSDNEIPLDALVDHRVQDIHNPSPPPLLISSSINKTIPQIPPTSSPPLEPRGSFIKPRDLPHPSTSPLDHPSRPPNPVPRSPPLPHLLAPSAPHPIKQLPHTPTPQTSHTLPVCHPSPFLPPNSPIDSKRLKIGMKSKMMEESDQTTGRNGCNINLQASSNFKVKQERPSPMMECGLCMHPPRSPHTPQCSFAFGIPPPSVPLMPGSPRPLGNIPPQRPVPHLASAGVPTIFKQEQQTGSYLNLEHVNRPSSEERPKNPAPPDTTSNEPPSPLPIPPPQSSLHPPAPPRPLLFTPDEPPRPPSPPPPQHSPRIKIERQTPQFICCCMRNECERSTSSRQSADFRRSSSTPQGQLCESASLRTTPHSMYKFEPPYLAGLRSRTPHSGVVNMYPPVSPSSARCLAPSNTALLQGLLPNQCLGVVGDLASNTTQHHSRVSVGVQTVFPDPLVSANSLTSPAAAPALMKIDQTTSTEDLMVPTPNRERPAENAVNGIILDQKPLLIGTSESLTTRSVPTSSVPDDHVATILNKFDEFTTLSGSSITQLIELSNREREVLACFDIIEQKDRVLAKERKKLSEILHRIHDMRLQRLQQYSSDGRTASYSSSLPSKSPNTEGSSDPALLQSIQDGRVFSNSSKMGHHSHLSIKPNNHQENHYMVSSSQEVSIDCKNSASPEYFSKDSLPHSVHGERCTSTSLVDRKEALFQTAKDSSESDEDLTPTPTNFTIKSASHAQYRLGRFMNRNRLNSGSTSEEYQEEKKEDGNRDPSIQSNNPTDATQFGSSSLKKEVLLLDSSCEKRIKETEKEENMEFSHSQDTSIIKEEHEHLGNLTPNRKGSLSGSPHSPKMRNSSGSEHGYSLRSRGPPSDSFDFNSDSQMSKDALIATNEDHLEVGDDKQQLNRVAKVEGDQADDELEKEEDLEVRGDLRSSSSSRLSDNESFKKRKRKRKTRYQINKCRKKKDITNIDSMRSPESSRNLEAFKKANHSEDSQKATMKKSIDFNSLCKEKFTVPPLHLAAVLDIKVVGNLIFTTSVDGTARLFDPVSGVVLSTYRNHTDSVTAIQIVGEPQFTVGSPGFQVITGSEDCFIHVYDGKTGVLTTRKNCTEPVRCLAYRWGYLFIGTDGGTGIKWNLKDKKLGEKIQFCGKGITRILTHVEGGRKVLVVGAKTTPIMIRDAISGLFLRTLDHVQLTMYAAVFEGNLLYTGGTEKNIFVYDYCEGDVKGHLDTHASVSNLILSNNHLHAICYDGVVRIFKLPEGELVKAIRVDSSSSMFICSALFRNKILIGNKTGQILCCQLFDVEK